MNLDDFAEFFVSGSDGQIHLRHSGCEWSEVIDGVGLNSSEANLKWLMVLANKHWMDSHSDNES